MLARMVLISLPHDPPTLISQSAGITGSCHHAQPLFVLRQSVALLPRLVCCGAILAHYNLCLLGLCNSLASVSRVAGNTGARHHTQLMFVFLVEMGFCHVGQAGLELLTSGDSASRSTGVTNATMPSP